MPKEPILRRDDRNKLILRLIGLLLFISGAGELVYASDRPTVSSEERLPAPQESETVTPTGERIKVTTFATVTVRLNPLLVLGVIQVLFGLLLLWVARERRPGVPRFLPRNRK